MPERRRSSSTFEHLWSTAGEWATNVPEPSSRWLRKGLGARGERAFNVSSWILIGLMATGWTWSIANTRDEMVPGMPVAAGIITSALTDTRAPSVSYLTDAALNLVSPLR